MNTLNKVKEAAKKVNAFTLIGALVFGGLTMSFTDGKEEATQASKLVDRSITTVTYGVLRTEGTKLYITAIPVAPGTGNCDLDQGHCKVTFPAVDENTIIIPDGAEQYVELSTVTPTGTGPYSE